MNCAIALPDGTMNARGDWIWIAQLGYQTVVLALLHLMLLLHSDMTVLPTVQPYRLIVYSLRVLFLFCCVVEVGSFVGHVNTAGLWSKIS